MTPITHAVGDPIVVSDFNTYVRDNTNFLYGDVVPTTITGFSNGWVNAGGAQFIKEGSTVFLDGIISSGTAAATAFTLPVGYRPTTTRAFAAVSVGAGLVVMSILATGEVQPQVAALTYLDGIAFSIR